MCKQWERIKLRHFLFSSFFLKMNLFFCFRKIWLRQRQHLLKMYKEIKMRESVKDRSKIRNVIKTHYCILLYDRTFILAEKQKFMCRPFNLIRVKQKPSISIQKDTKKSKGCCNSALRLPLINKTFKFTILTKGRKIWWCHIFMSMRI